MQLTVHVANIIRSYIFNNLNDSVISRLFDTIPQARVDFIAFPWSSKDYNVTIFNYLYLNLSYYTALNFVLHAIPHSVLANDFATKFTHSGYTRYGRVV